MIDLDLINNFDWIYSISAWASLITLTILEIVLGIDNIIIIAILVSKMPSHQRDRTRIIGLSLAMITRILLLVSIFWIMKLTKPLITILNNAFSGRDLILIGGGIFLIWKSVKEIYEQITIHKNENKYNQKNNFFVVLMQIIMLDIVFSLDSVITAVGMAEHLSIMIIAVILAVLIMLFASKYIAKFVDTYPSIKILALSFLILVGIVLIAEGFKIHINKGYIYFAMAFSLFVESINIYIKKRSKI